MSQFTFNPNAQAPGQNPVPGLSTPPTPLSFGTLFGAAGTSPTASAPLVLAQALATTTTPEAEASPANLALTELPDAPDITNTIRQTVQNTAPNTSYDPYESGRATAMGASIPRTVRAEYAGVVDAAVTASLTAPPANLNEAGWQRNSAIWSAQDADVALARASQAEQSLAPTAPASTRSAADTATSNARTTATQAWDKAEQAFAREYREVLTEHARSNPTSQQTPAEVVAEHRASILSQSFDPRFRQSIEAASLAQPLDASALVDPTPEITAAANAFAEQVATTLETDGNAAALDEILSIRSGLPASPLVTGGAVHVSKAEQAERQLLMNHSLNTALAPVYVSLEKGAGAHFEAILGDHQPTLSFDTGPRRLSPSALTEVSSELGRYVEVLPPDRTVAFVESQEVIWTSVIRSVNQDGIGHQPGTAMRSISAITDELAMRSEGGALIDQMADEFVSYRLEATNTGAANLNQQLAEPLAEGQGYYLMTGIINKLSETDYDGVTAQMLGTMDRAVEDYTEKAAGNVRDQAENRETYFRIIHEFSSVNREPDGAVFSPGTVDVGGRELQNALVEYMEGSDTFLPNEHRLSKAIDADAQAILHMHLASSLLSQRAAESQPGEQIADRLATVTADDPANGGLARFHANSSLMLGDVIAMGEQAAQTDLLGNNINATPADLNAATALAFSFRAALTLPGAGSIKAGPVPAMVLASRGGITAWFGGASPVLAEQAMNGDAPGTNELDQFNDGVRASRFALMGGRETWALAATLAKDASAQSSHYELFAGTHPQIFRALNNGVMWVAVGTDLLTVGNSIYKHRDDLGSRDSMIETGIASTVLTGNALFLKASQNVFKQAVVRGTAAGISSGPALPLAFGLTAIASAANWQYDRVKQSERFESPEMRQALAHIGSLENNGEAREPREVSDRHSRNPDISPYVPGALTPDQIAYSGISGSAVNGVLNNTSDPANPESSIEVLAALADRHNMSGRELLVDWYDNATPGFTLTDQQQRELPIAAFEIDLNASGISDFNLTKHIHPQLMDLRNNIDLLTVYDKITPDAGDDLMAYVVDNELITSETIPQTLSRANVLDADKLRGLLGLGPLTGGQEAPTPEQRESARALMAGTEFRNQFRPETLDGLEFWLDINDYPPIGTSKQTTADLSDAQRPEALRTYVIQQGDRLWDLPGAETLRAGDQTMLSDVVDLIGTTNQANGELPDFQPGMIDGNLHTQARSGQPGRDPDLIQPGERVYLRPLPEPLAPEDTPVKAHTVGAGESIWKLAGPGATIDDVRELLMVHNANNGEQTDFDLALLNTNANAGSSPAGRNPFVIHPGETLYLADPTATPETANFNTPALTTATTDVPSVTGATMPEPVAKAYTIQSGDTLWDLAGPDATMADVLNIVKLTNEHNGNQPDLDPDHIRPGQVIYLPGAN